VIAPSTRLAPSSPTAPSAHTRSRSGEYNSFLILLDISFDHALDKINEFYFCSYSSYIYGDTTQLRVATFCHRGIGACLLYGRL
jgi:hypothetical protein